MKVVVDTNILFSIFTNDEYFKKFLFDNDIQLFAPERVILELDKYSDRICELSGFTKEEFNLMLQALPDVVTFRKISKETLSNLQDKLVDSKDVPFLALAIELGVPILSEDKHLKKQGLVKVYTFEELKRLVEEN